MNSMLINIKNKEEENIEVGTRMKKNEMMTKKKKRPLRREWNILK